MKKVQLNRRFNTGSVVNNSDEKKRTVMTNYFNEDLISTFDMADAVMLPKLEIGGLSKTTR